MKRLFAGLLILALMLSLTAIAEGTVITDADFTFERLRNGSVKLTAYTGDPNVQTINIPSTVQGAHVEQIGSYAFDGCQAVNITIPDTVSVIEGFAFNKCTQIQKITIPNSVIFVSGNPFTDCSALVNISLDPKHPTLQVTSDGVLYSRKNRMLICYPCSKADRTFAVMKGTVTINKYAFTNCSTLESISLPTTVTEIGEGAFMGCTGLVSVSLPESLLTLGSLAFAGCTKLNGVSIPKNILRIEPSTFFQCESLMNVQFPENLTDICGRAFLGCKQLQEVKLPENVARIGDNAFNGCAALTDVYMPVSVTEIGADAFENCSVKLYMHLEENAFAEIYARLYNISITYGNEDSFLTDPVPEPAQ